MTVDLSRLDVPTPELEAQIAHRQAVYTLLIARAQAPLDHESDRIAYALDVRLIETDADVATDQDYPEWAAQLAAQPTYHHAREAS